MEGGFYVTPWPVHLIAITSTAGCFILWFREVRRVMKEWKNTVGTAHSQLVEWEKKAAVSPDDPDTAAILRRCQSVYQQAVEHYNRAMRKPFHYLPAYLMGFRSIPESNFEWETKSNGGPMP